MKIYLGKLRKFYLGARYNLLILWFKPWLKVRKSLILKNRFVYAHKNKIRLQKVFVMLSKDKTYPTL